MDQSPSPPLIARAFAKGRLWFIRLPLLHRLIICIAIIFLPSFLLSCWLSLNTYSALNAANLTLATIAAKNSVDTLDRLVFERYADTQIFSGMPLVKALDRSKLPQILDHLVTTYAPYYSLALVTDRTGQILAVSRIDQDGQRIPSAKLLGRNVAKESWFMKTLQANQAVFVEDFHQNPLIHEVFQGQRHDQGMVMGFHATIRNSAGQVVGVWTAYLSEILIQQTLTAIASAQSPTAPLPLALFNRQGHMLFHVNSQRSSNPPPIGLGTSQGFSHYKGLGWQIRVSPSQTQLPVQTILLWLSLVVSLILVGGGIGLAQSVKLLILQPLGRLNQKAVELSQTPGAPANAQLGLNASLSSLTSKTDIPNIAHRDAASKDEIGQLEATFDFMSDKIRRHLQQTASLTTAAQAITKTGLSIQAVRQNILKTAAQLTGARYAALGIFDESESTLSEFHTVGIDETTRLDIGEGPKGVGLLGHMNKQRQALRLADLHQHPDSAGFPAHHPPMRSFLGQSIFVHDQLLGRIYLTEKQGAAEFSLEDETALAALAHLAGVSIANARLYEQASQAEAKYSRILESTSEGIYGLDLEGRCTFINPAALTMLGYGQDEVLDQPMHAVVHHTRPNGSPYPIEECTIIKHTRAGQSRHLPHEIFWRKDGTSFAVELTSAPILKEDRIIGSVVNFTDITARMRTESSLRESEERFRQLAENIRQVFWITSPEKNRMLYISLAYEQIWGRTCESLYASPWSWADAIHPDDRERIVQAAQAKQINGAYDEEYRIVRPDGSVRWIRDRAYPVRDASGALERIIGIAEDITTHKELEEQLRHSQKIEAIGQLASGIAHDFNNLLSVINGYSKILLAQIPPDDPLGLREDLTEILEAGQRASKITTQLLALGRRQLLNPSLVDSHRLIQNIASMLSQLLDESITIRLEQTPDTAWIVIDEDHLQQTILNLALNARDAMPHGGILFIMTSIVHLNNTPLPLAPGSYVTISIQDTGTGMSPEVCAHCFEPFFTTKAHGKGTGLGLAMVYGLVAQSHGHITVTSEPGHGSTFTIYLPQAETTGPGGASKEACAAPIQPDLEPPAPRFADTTVLLVEDEPKVLAMVRKILENTGCLVLTARNGSDALKLAAQYQGTIHVLLSDITMPGITGHELAERLLTARPGIRILLMSGYANNGTFRKFLDTIKGQFVSKPFLPETLIAALAATLAHPVTPEK